jgi:MFS family permease
MTTAPTSLRAIRDFRILWIAGLAAALTGQMSAVALPLVVLRSTGSAVAAGAVGTMAIAALLITMLPGGVLADRAERRRLMICCDLAAAAAAAALGVAVLLGSAPLALVLLVAAAAAALASLYQPAALGLLRAIVPADLLGLAAARLQARSAAARLAGPLAGGALFAVEPALPFLIQAGGLSLCAALLLLIRTRSRPRTKAKGFSRAEFTAGLSFLWRRPFLRTVVLTFGLGMNAGFGALMFVALAVSSDGGESGVGAGTVVALIAGGSLLGALIAPRFHFRRPGPPIAFACWLCALVTVVLVLSHGVLLMGLLVAASLAAAAVANIGFVAALLRATPDELVGRVQSAGGFLSSLAMPLGPLAGGLLLTAWGPSKTFAVLAAVFAVCATVLSCAPSMRRPPPPAAAPSAGQVGEAGPPAAPTAEDPSHQPGRAAAPGPGRPSYP